MVKLLAKAQADAGSSGDAGENGGGSAPNTNATDPTPRKTLSGASTIALGRFFAMFKTGAIIGNWLGGVLSHNFGAVSLAFGTMSMIALIGVACFLLLDEDLSAITPSLIHLSMMKHRS